MRSSTASSPRGPWSLGTRLLAILVLAFSMAILPSPSPANEGKPAEAPSNVRLKQLMLPAVVNGRIDKYVTYEVTLELKKGTAVPEGTQTRLQDVVIAALYEGIEKGWINQGAITNATALRRRVVERCEPTLGKGSITRVLISPAGRSSAGPQG